jgi:PAS domain S-box-containing protein
MIALFNAWSIKSKAALVTTAGVLLLFTAFAAFEIQRIRVEMQAMLGAQQLTLISRLADELDDKIMAAHRALIVTAEATPPDALDNLAALERRLLDQPGYRSLFDDVFVIGRDGRVLIDLPARQRRGIDVHDRDYVRDTLRSRKPVISEPYTGRGPVVEPAVMMTAPILDRNGEVVAMLTGNIHSLRPNFLGKLREAHVGATGRFALFSRNRTIIVSQDAERIMTQGPAPGISPFFDHAVAGKKGWEEATSSLGMTALYSYTPLASVPWVLVAALPSEEAHAPLAAAQAQAMGIAALLALLLAPLVWFGMQHVLSPIGRLRDTIRRIRSEPDSAALAKLSRHDELGDLAEDFDALTRERRDATQALRESEEKFAKAFRASPLFVAIVTRADGRYIEVNDAHMHATGHTREELFGRTSQEIGRWKDPQDRQRALDTLARDGRVSDFEAVLVRKSGETMVCEIWAEPIDIAGKPCIIWISHDVTARKKAEAEILQLNEALEQRVRTRTLELEAVAQDLAAFSYSVSHDLRAPLRAIISFSGLLSESVGARLGEDDRHSLQRIVANAGRMSQLIDDVLTYSRLADSQIRRKPVDLDAVVADIVRELRDLYPKAEIVINPLGRTDADPTMVRQIFHNLIGNALKYSAKGAQPRVEITAQSSDGAVEYVVQDNGVGFDMRYAGKLFGLFSRLHSDAEFEGTGAGLAIVNRLVARHNGRISATAEPGKGATFRFHL